MWEPYTKGGPLLFAKKQKAHPEPAPTGMGVKWEVGDRAGDLEFCVHKAVCMLLKITVGCR